MTYDELTAEQQAAVQALDAELRADLAALAKLLHRFRAVANYWAGNLETVVGSLTDGEAIPTGVGYAGAQPLTKGEFTTLVGYLMVASDTADNAAGSLNTNYHRALYAKAAGPGNTAGA